VKGKNISNSLRILSQGGESCKHVADTERTLLDIIWINSVKKMIIALKYLPRSEPN